MYRSFPVFCIPNSFSTYIFIPL